MISAGIVGGTGYTAGELLRILVNHEHVDIAFVYSTSQAGEQVSTVHDDLFAYPELKFTDQVVSDVDVLFLCLGHGNSAKFLEENTFSEGTKIIDLSNDFRLQADADFLGKHFVYGLPELNKTAIQQANAIANPGCFATAIQLALLPLAKAGLLTDDVHINGITGSTGAGRGLAETAHFSWRNNNISIYKAFSHQHLGEISESIVSLQSDFSAELNFLPVRGDFTRGIFVSAYTKTEASEAELKALFSDFYKDAVFTKVSDQTIHLKQVVNTNYGLVSVEKKGNKVLVTSVIDNLLKGASGQAVQNMNLLFGLEESTGLNLKANYF